MNRHNNPRVFLPICPPSTTPMHEKRQARIEPATNEVKSEYTSPSMFRAITALMHGSTKWVCLSGRSRKANNNSPFLSQYENGEDVNHIPRLVRHLDEELLPGYFADNVLPPLMHYGCVIGQKRMRIILRNNGCRVLRWDDNSEDERFDEFGTELAEMLTGVMREYAIDITVGYFRVQTGRPSPKTTQWIYSFTTNREPGVFHFHEKLDLIHGILGRGREELVFGKTGDGLEMSWWKDDWQLYWVGKPSANTVAPVSPWRRFWNKLKATMGKGRRRKEQERKPQKEHLRLINDSVTGERYFRMVSAS